MPTLQAAIDDAIRSAASVFDLTDVQDDLEEEQARHVAQVEQYTTDREDPSVDTAMDVDETDLHASSKLRQTVESASRGVTDGTAHEYMRISNGIDPYLVEKGHIKATDTYFCENPPENWPTLLIAWIMDAYAHDH
ncbi:hypothetical protein GGX14DRAFT_573020 [Mycena pura]|uniref:Uncharacterized protein n=1 Tax=Mycena pura TaxID=153505 RepID=A0AAD6UZY8_9AGAR|nr:hypothetical protein GGX14DRAFT_573020 [Mycena pura]